MFFLDYNNAVFRFFVSCASAGACVHRFKQYCQGLVPCMRCLNLDSANVFVLLDWGRWKRHRPIFVLKTIIQQILGPLGATGLRNYVFQPAIACLPGWYPVYWPLGDQQLILGGCQLGHKDWQWAPPDPPPSSLDWLWCGFKINTNSRLFPGFSHVTKLTLQRTKLVPNTHQNSTLRHLRLQFTAKPSRLYFCQPFLCNSYFRRSMDPTDKVFASKSSCSGILIALK